MWLTARAGATECDTGKDFRIVTDDASGDSMLILGAGYSGQALAARLLPDGWQVSGTSRTPAGVAALANRGIAGIAFDAATTGWRLPTRATALLCSLPPDDAGDPVARALLAGTAALPGPLRWIGYLSTTGVYGDSGGDWVDEETQPAPANARGRRRLLAERQWLELGARAGIPAQIFRLPGIYGPGRSALDDVRAGKARRIDKPGHAFSRVHVDDIAGALVASLASPQAGAVYNVADDRPAPSADVVAYACELLGREPPPLVPYAEIEPTLSPMSREFYASNRRVRNDRIKRALGLRLLHPDYRSGLKAILAAERAN